MQNKKVNGMTKLDELIQELCPDGVKYKALGEICKLVTGATPSKTNSDLLESHEN